MVFPLALLRVKLGLVGRFRAFGHSMDPVIRSGSDVTIEPVDIEKLTLGDIVVAKVADETVMHLVKTIEPRERRVEISGTSGTANGWTSFDCVYAICTRIQGETVPGAHATTRRRLLGRLRRPGRPDRSGME